MKRNVSRKDRGNVNRFWYRLRPTALLPKTRRFYSEKDRRAYQEYIRSMRAHTALVLPI